MTEAQETAILKRLEELEKRVRNADAEKTQTWYSASEFFYTFRMGRTRLNSLIRSGVVEVKKISTNRYLYRWVA